MNATVLTSADNLSHGQANVFRTFSADPVLTERRQESTESWGNRRVAKTDIENSSANKFATFTLTEQSPVVPSVTTHQEVAGTVIRFDDLNVECEVSHKNQKVAVVLPRVFFEFHIQYGTPFSLSLIDDEGIRKPRVTPRKPDMARFQQLRDHAAELVNSL